MATARTWNRKFLDWLEHPLPDNYLVFDCETQGLKRDWALPVEIGHCVVRDRVPAHQGSFALNWYGYPGIDADWFTETLEHTRKVMAEKNKSYRYTPDYIRKHGKDPTKVLKFYYDLFVVNRQCGARFLGHNAVFFDSALLTNVFKEAANLEWTFGDDELYDSGGMEKALLSDLEPYPDEYTLRQYFKRVHGSRKPGIKWNIEICVKRYKLAERFNLDVKGLHGAAEDAYVSHLLFEEHRNIE